MIKTPLRGRKDPLKFASLLPTCGFVAQLVERPTSIWEARVQAPSKPEFFSGFFFSAISLIAVYLLGSIRYLSPAGLIWFISYIICDIRHWQALGINLNTFGWTRTCYATFERPMVDATRTLETVLFFFGMSGVRNISLHCHSARGLARAPGAEWTECVQVSSQEFALV